VDEIDRELAARGLREFVRQAWPTIEPSTPFVPGWHIDAIVEHFEAVARGDIRNLLINVPPRHMKSLLVSVFWQAWEWIAWLHDTMITKTRERVLPIRMRLPTRKRLRARALEARRERGQE
jgi:hypothetical protein